MRTEIYEYLMSVFMAADGSWLATDTIYDWEASGCEASAREDFPYWGDYSAIPQFATTGVTTASGDINPTATCYVAEERTPYIVWQKDAFRSCILAGANYAAAGGTGGSTGGSEDASGGDTSGGADVPGGRR